MDQIIQLNHHLQTDRQAIQDEPISLSSSPLELGSSSSSSSSLSSSSSSSLNSTNTSQSPTNIPINAGHISMLINNDIQGFQSQIPNLSDLSETDHNNSIFHLAASIGQSDFINEFAIDNRRLLTLPNSNRDLPIHCAARACQFGAVKTLVRRAEHFDELGSMLEAKNAEGNTALHIALENKQQEMAWFLFGKCPKTFYSINTHKISPLYLAIKAEFWDLVKFMLYLGKTDTEAETHLLSGYSVIHAAIVAKKEDIVVTILEYFPELMYLEDELKRYPLSYAAYSGFLKGVKYMLSMFQNQAFKMDANGWYPIHWACSGGYLKIVNCFFSNLLPVKARLLLTKNGQSILHVAAASGRKEIVKFILRQPECATMINMKDKDGNTPLHLASMGKHPCVVYAFTWDHRVLLTLQNNKRETALDLAQNYGDYASFNERMTWLSLRYAGVPSAPQYHYFNDVLIMEPVMVNTTPSNVQPLFNHNNNTSTTFCIVGDQQDHPIVNTNSYKKKTKYKERINTLLLVATLVATVTFACGFSVPGGYNDDNPDKGMATLVRRRAFQVFVLTNTLAMCSAILSVILLVWAHLDDLSLVLLSLRFALPLLGFSLAMMLVAFISGFYVTIHTLAPWLGVVVLVIGGFFIFALLTFYIPLFLPLSRISNKFLRYLFYIPFKPMLLACDKCKNGAHYSL